MDVSSPSQLTQHPDALPSPPVVTRVQQLRFEDLTWANFERLLWRLASAEGSIEHCALFGRSGQAQHGIDIYARQHDGKMVCWQAKNRAKFGLPDLKKALERFRKGGWYEASARFVLCVRSGLSDAKLQREIELQAARLRKDGVVLEAVDGSQLTERLRGNPYIVDDFFGRPWVAALCGDTVAASLNHRLTSDRLSRLRHHLRAFYLARCATLDPGLSLSAGPSGTSDVRRRFVERSVDASTPFSEPQFEQEAETHDYPPQDPSYEEDILEPRTRPALVAPSAIDRVSSDKQSSVSRSLEWWLVDGNRHVLVGSAGSGKSTVLRCLALDLVDDPSALPRVCLELGTRIPLLLSFSLWCRMTQSAGREIGIGDVIAATFGAHVEDVATLEALKNASDERIVVLIDGIDEYVDEQAGRTTLATIEAVARIRNFPMILTARAAGLRRLGQLPQHWSIARLTDLSRAEQVKLANALVRHDAESAEMPSESHHIERRVAQFFQQLDRVGSLGGLAGVPLLLHGLLIVGARQAILPRSRFQLFEQLIAFLLDTHQARRHTAAASVYQQSQAFADEGQRRSALAYLAYEMHERADADGMERRDARRCVEEYLTGEAGPGCSKEVARLGASELTAANADTSGLLVERSTGMLAFCHAAFREHLAGMELATRPFESQREFARRHAGDPRWRACLVTMLQASRRKAEVESILEAVLAETDDEAADLERRLFLADAAFACGRGAVAQSVAVRALDAVEESFIESERVELLSLTLDAPRTGRIGEAIAQRLDGWWPRADSWQQDAYLAMASWEQDDASARAIWLGLFADEQDAALLAASALAKAFGPESEWEHKLRQMYLKAEEPIQAAAALYTLGHGWPTCESLPKFLRNSSGDRASPVRAAAGVTLARLGDRSSTTRDLLLEQAQRGGGRYRNVLGAEAVQALGEVWTQDPNVKEACFEQLKQPGAFALEWALEVLSHDATNDPRVGEWLGRMLLDDSYAVMRLLRPSESKALQRIIDSSEAAREGLDERVRLGSHAKLDHHHVAQLAAMHPTPSHKQLMLDALGPKRTGFVFWPIQSLLDGWGMQDSDVRRALTDLVQEGPESADAYAHLLPRIVEDSRECARLLQEIASLKVVHRPDFLLSGLRQVAASVDEESTVPQLLRHLARRPWEDLRYSLLLTFPRHPEVRALALASLNLPSPPLAALAAMYGDDAELRSALLKRIVPLPAKLRRQIAVRSCQRSDDPILFRVLEGCEREVDPEARVQATIGRSGAYVAMGLPTQSVEESLGRQVRVQGYDRSARRVAGFSGLLALRRLESFVAATGDDGKPLRVAIVGDQPNAAALELIAQKWDEVASAFGNDIWQRLSDWNSDATDEAWNRLAPFAPTSPPVSLALAEYCANGCELPTSSILNALAGARSRSSLLFDCCKRVLLAPHVLRDFHALDKVLARATAARTLAHSFGNDNAALDVLTTSASIHQDGTPFIGLADAWPEHPAVAEAWRRSTSRRRVVWAAELWIAARCASSGEFAALCEAFVRRSEVSPWDLAADALRAVRVRAEQDDVVVKDLVARTLASESASMHCSIPPIAQRNERYAVSAQELAEQLVSRAQAHGASRFGLDIGTNTLKRVTAVLAPLTAATRSDI